MPTETKEHWLCREARSMDIGQFATPARTRIVDMFLGSLGEVVRRGNMGQVQELHSALLAAEKIIEERTKTLASNAGLLLPPMEHSIHFTKMSTCAFIAAYCSTNKCEIFPAIDSDGLTTGMIACIPTKENAESTIELGGVTDFTKAEIVARHLGLDPQWK